MAICSVYFNSDLFYRCVSSGYRNFKCLNSFEVYCGYFSGLCYVFVLDLSVEDRRFLRIVAKLYGVDIIIFKGRPPHFCRI